MPEIFAEKSRMIIFLAFLPSLFGQKGWKVLKNEASRRKEHDAKFFLLILSRHWFLIGAQSFTIPDI